MSKSRIWWFTAFILVYVAHAGGHLAWSGAFATSFDPEMLRIVSLVSLIVLILLIVGYVARQDEVQRKFAFMAAGVGAVVAGFLSYGVAGYDLQADYLTKNYWAIAMIVFLGVYGVLSWRGRM